MDEKHGLLGDPQSNTVPSAPPPYPDGDSPAPYPVSGYSAQAYTQPAVPPPSYYQHQQPLVTGTSPAALQGQRAVVVVQGTPVMRVCRAPPPDYTAYAIMGIICFFPLGLMALNMATKAKVHAAEGNMQAAYSDAVSARLMSRLAVSIGSIILTVIILAVVLPISLY